MRAEIFTTPNCVKCTSLKNQIADLDSAIFLFFIDATTPEGSKLAVEREVKSAPTVFLYDDKEMQIGIAHDIDEIEEIIAKQAQ